MHKQASIELSLLVDVLAFNKKVLNFTGLCVHNIQAKKCSTFAKASRDSIPCLSFFVVFVNNGVIVASALDFCIV